MKTFTILLAALAFSFGVAGAQDLSGQTIAQVKLGVDVGGFKAPATLGPSQSSKFPNTHPNLKPQVGGIFADGGKYGTQLINPCAPASYGMGEKYLSAPSSTYDLQRESGPAAHRDAGGFKFFSFEF